MTTPLWAMGLVVFGTFLGSTASLLLKKGSSKFNLNPLKQIRNWQVIVGLSLYVISSITYIIALKHGELSVIYPLVAAQYIWVPLLSVKYLNENMNKIKWSGIGLIVFGIVMVTI